MFKPYADYAPWRNRLLANGRVQVPDVLEDSYATQIRAALAGETEWALSYSDDGTAKELDHVQYAALDAAQRKDFVARIARTPQTKYTYAFESYPMIRRYDDPARADSLLRLLVDAFHHEQMLDFIRRLTGDASIAQVRIQATRYLPGHFLRRHDDSSDEAQARRFAFVFNLGQGWQADWGGLLHFLDMHGSVVDTFVPVYNSLSLFKVPQFHYVSRVAPWAEAPRYALTGWFLA
jgi:Rps23 Pro-64 3,4-dihydroxylase Tpa1-like proline 4-hydroxylase